MTLTFTVILLSAFAAAWGVRAAGLSGGGLGWRIFAGILFLVLGIHAVLLAALGGDGLVFPGKQLSPEISNVFGEEFAAGEAWWAPQPLFSVVVILGHLALLLARTSRANWLRPLPATIVFIVIAVLYRDRIGLPPRQYVRTVGPHTNGYLTMVPGRSASDLVFAIGDRDSILLDVVHRHTAREMPPEPRLRWTGDGEALVFSVWSGSKPYDGDRLLAVTKEGDATGWLPPKEEPWPPSKYDRRHQSVDHQRKQSQAERDVAEFLTKHDHVHVEKR